MSYFAELRSIRSLLYEVEARLENLAKTEAMSFEDVVDDFNDIYHEFTSQYHEPNHLNLDVIR